MSRIFVKIDAETHEAINSAPPFILCDNIPNIRPVMPKSRQYIIAETGLDMMYTKIVPRSEPKDASLSPILFVSMRKGKGATSIVKGAVNINPIPNAYISTLRKTHDIHSKIFFAFTL